MKQKWTETRRLDEEPQLQSPETDEADGMDTISFDSGLESGPPTVTESTLTEGSNVTEGSSNVTGSRSERKLESRSMEDESHETDALIRKVDEEQDLCKVEHHVLKVSHFSIITITSSILGVGMFSVSSAIASSGLLVGCLLLVLSGLGSACGFYLLGLIATHDKKKTESIFGISQMSFLILAISIDLFVIVNCVGIMLAYLITVGDTMEAAMKIFHLNSSIFNSREVWTLFTLISMILLSPIHKLHAPIYAGVITAMASGCILVSVIYGVSSSKEIVISIYGAPKIGQIFVTLPVFLFLFSSHQVLTSYNEGVYIIVIPELKKFLPSLVISFCVYLSIGLLGYAAYGINTPSNILVLKDPVLEHSPILSTVLQIIGAFSALLSCPLYVQSCKSSLKNLLSLCIPAHCNRCQYFWVYGATIILSFLSFVVSCFFLDLFSVLSVVGAVVSLGLCYILPGIFYFSLQKTGTPRKLAFCWILGGVFVMSTSIFFIVLYKIHQMALMWPV